MKTNKVNHKQSVSRTFFLGGLAAVALAGHANAQIGNGLVSYWPLDEIQGTKTPDLVSFYDMELSNLE
ncbi:MAG: hypothetical protein VW804_12450, partial [Verrucomicrobiota bacterium]